MVSINSCREKEPAITFISSKVFTDFPSASAIEYHNNQLYVFGDDATSLLILDTNYNVQSSIQYIAGTKTRLSKSLKPDIEAATFLNFADKTFLYAFGSQSTSNRKKVYVFPVDSLNRFVAFEYPLKKIPQIKEWNIEGAAFVEDQLVLANRANLKSKINYLLLATFQTTQKENAAKVIQMTLPQQSVVAGVSGLFYAPEKDLLLFTASEEATPDAVQDGAIGESYLGIITDFSKKMFRKSIKPDAFLKLADVSTEFKQQKVESVCVQKTEGNNLLLHLVADNDNGESKLFKILLKL